MSDSEARDAFLAVDVDLPNGAKINGRPVPYPQAMRMLLLSEQFYAGAPPSESIIPLLELFEQTTGITQEKLLGACPNLSLGEVVNLVQRFFYWRRSVPTAPPSPPAASPSGTSA